MDMGYRNNRRCRWCRSIRRTHVGTTVVELIVAMAVMTVILGAVVPLFAGMRNSSDTQQACSEMVQNARVLHEHLLRHLAQATRLLAVSSPSEAAGYLEFESADGAVYHYGINAEGYVEFGPVGAAAELAGPVDFLTFVCYDANDLATPTEVAGHIRFVTWDGALRSSRRLTRDRAVAGACCLRANGNRSWEYLTATYDFATREQGVAAFAFADEGKPQVPSQPDVPSRVLNASEYDAIEVDDGMSQVVAVTSQANFAQVRFTFRISEPESDVVGFTATWNGKGVSMQQARTDGASLYVWSYLAGGYELLSESPDTESEVTVVGTRSESAADYIGGADGNTMVLLVVANDRETGQKGNRLFTDYVKVELAIRVESGPLVP